MHRGRQNCWYGIFVGVCRFSISPGLSKNNALKVQCEPELRAIPLDNSCRKLANIVLQNDPWPSNVSIAVHASQASVRRQLVGALMEDCSPHHFAWAEALGRDHGTQHEGSVSM